MPSPPRPAPRPSPVGTPVSRAASDSFGVSTDTSASSSRDSSLAGAGFRITRAPASDAVLAAATTDSSGVSSCTRSTSSGERRSAQPAICSGARSALAPGATAMLFSPRSSTRMSATPERVCATRRTRSIAIPSAASAASVSSPSASSPRQATKVTDPPARAAATAWLAPFPPRAVKKSPPITVSPGRGSVETRTTMSVFELPTTTMRASEVTGPLRAGWRRGERPEWPVYGRG